MPKPVPQMLLQLREMPKSWQMPLGTILRGDVTLQGIEYKEKGAMLTLPQNA